MPRGRGGQRVPVDPSHALPAAGPAARGIGPSVVLGAEDELRPPLADQDERPGVELGPEGDPRPGPAQDDGSSGTDLGPEEGGGFVPGQGPFGGAGTNVPPSAPGVGPAVPNRIVIRFDPTTSESISPCERIQFIQTVQILIDGEAVDPGDFYSDWEYRDNTALDDDPGTPENEASTHVDRLKGKSTPFYGGNGAGTGSSSPGSTAGGGTPATMDDTPFAPDTWFAPGGFDRDGGPGPPPVPGGNDWNANEIVFRFEACAFCECGDDAGQYFGCLTWEYRRTRAEVAAGTPGTATITGQADAPSQPFLDAVERWCDTNNYDPGQDC